MLSEKTVTHESLREETKHRGKIYNNNSTQNKCTTKATLDLLRITIYDTRPGNEVNGLFYSSQGRHAIIVSSITVWLIDACDVMTWIDGFFPSCNCELLS